MRTNIENIAATATLFIPVRVGAVFGGNAEHPFRADDDPGLAVLQGAAAPRNELGAKQGVVAAALELAVRHPIEAAVRANGADVHLSVETMTVKIAQGSLLARRGAVIRIGVQRLCWDYNRSL